MCRHDDAIPRICRHYGWHRTLQNVLLLELQSVSMLLQHPCMPRANTSLYVSHDGAVLERQAAVPTPGYGLCGLVTFNYITTFSCCTATSTHTDLSFQDACIYWHPCGFCRLLSHQAGGLQCSCFRESTWKHGRLFCTT